MNGGLCGGVTDCAGIAQTRKFVQVWAGDREWSLMKALPDMTIQKPTLGGPALPLVELGSGVQQTGSIFLQVSAAPPAP